MQSKIYSEQITIVLYYKAFFVVRIKKVSMQLNIDFCNLVEPFRNNKIKYGKNIQSNKKIEIILLKKISLKSMILEKKMNKVFFAKIKKPFNLNMCDRILRVVTFFILCGNSITQYPIEGFFILDSQCKV